MKKENEVITKSMQEEKKVKDLSPVIKESAWDRYRASRAVTIELDEVGLEGFWVKAQPISTFGRDAFDSLYSLPENEQHIKSFEMFVVDWNLPTADGEDVLPVPSEDDNNTWFGVIPAEVQAYLVSKIAEIEKDRLQIPPGIGEQ